MPPPTVHPVVHWVSSMKGRAGSAGSPIFAAKGRAHEGGTTGGVEERVVIEDVAGTGAQRCDVFDLHFGRFGRIVIVDLAGPAPVAFDAEEETVAKFEVEAGQDTAAPR